MLRRLIRDFRQLHRALVRYYRKRDRRLTPEQVATELVRQMHERERWARRHLGRSND